MEKNNDIGQRRIDFSIGIFFVIIGLIPVVRAGRFLFSSGVDIPSNDDVIFFNAIEHIGQSNYNWLNYFRDTMVNGHNFAVGLAIFWANCHLTAASQTAMMTGALILVLIKLLLLSNYLFAKLHVRVQMAMFLVLSTILFAPSQTAILAFPTFGFTWNLSLLSSIFSIWVISKWKNSAPACAASAISIVIGCWNGALSLPTIALLYLQTFLNGGRKVRDYLWVTAASIIAATPYITTFTSNSGRSKSIADQLLGFNPTTFLNVLGRPFANGTGFNYGHIEQAYDVALFGIGCLAFLVFAAVWKTDLRLHKDDFIPAAMCTLLGLLTVALVASTRPSIAPWYSSISSLFWCGLAALSLYCFVQASKSRRIVRICSLMILLAIVVLNAVYSRKFEDKQFYLDNRSPACASLLRHYAEAPTYATRMVFKLKNLQPYTIAAPLERHSWSIFARHREYLLQGDCVLPEVELIRTKGGRVFWVSQTDQNAKTPQSWKSYAHLNLVLEGDSKVLWHVNIPKQSDKVLLYCKLLSNKTSDEVVSIKSEDGTSCSINGSKMPDAINLAVFAGKAATICFHHTGAGLCMFHYPRLELVAPPDPPQSVRQYAPANVLNETKLPDDSRYTLKKVDDQRISIRPPRPLSNQEFQSLDFLVTGRQALVNCIVRLKNGRSLVFEIPIFQSGKQAVYTQPGRIFDDDEDEIEEISLVNNSPGVLSDYVLGGYLKTTEQTK